VNQAINTDFAKVTVARQFLTLALLWFANLADRSHYVKLGCHSSSGFQFHTAHS